MESTKRTLLPSPREKANILSILFYTWTFSFFKKGFKKNLTLDDIYETLQCDKSEKLGNRLEVNWKKELLKSNKRPSLIRAVAITFKYDIILLGLGYFFSDVIVRVCQPLLLKKLLLYFRKGNDSITHQDAILYATGIVLLSVAGVMTFGQTFLLAFHSGMRIRAAICSLVYRKALRLSQRELSGTSTGKVVNLLSNDMNCFDWLTFFINSIWTAPILIIIVGILLWNEIRWAGIVGIVIVSLVAPIQSFTAKMSSKYRFQTAQRTDERIRFMDEIIYGIQVIKMYAWEIPFTRIISQIRITELEVIRKNSYVRALFMTFMLFTTRIAMFFTMLSIVLLYGSDQITSDKVFSITSYLGVLTLVVAQRFVRSVAITAESFITFRRLTDFLTLDEKIPKTNGNTANGIENLGLIDEMPIKEKHSNKIISLTNASARWSPPSNANKVKKKAMKPVVIPQIEQALTLDNINIDFRKGKLIGVIGPVGAGKTSLLQALLHELPLESGMIQINGSIAYANQEPWVFVGSVRQNILFGEKFHRQRYDAVVKTCALLKDFEQLKNGDLTLIGERGLSLSGGQKARVNLARAVYRKADIYLLDDPLSAVDAHVGAHMFDNCIGPKGRLARKGATRILVTHQVHFLKEADWIIALRDGKIETQGPPESLDVDLAKIVGSVEKTDDNAQKNVEELSYDSESSDTADDRANGDGLNRRTKKSNGSSNGCDVNIKNEKFTEDFQMEASSKGQVAGSLAMKYFNSGAHWSILFILLFSFIITQVLASGADYWVSIWTKQEEMRIYRDNYVKTNNSDASQDDSWSLSTNFCILVHCIILIALFIIAISRAIGFYFTCNKASRNLHDSMFKSMISSTMRFFETNPSGRILNRFSKDIGAVDEILPKAILDATQLILGILASIAVTALVNPYFLLPIGVLSIVFILIRKVYVRISKDVKRLEGITKSPVFTHLGATFNGLSTIRAFGVEEIVRKEFDEHQDINNACWFMFTATNATFSLSLDLLCSILLASITYSCVFIESGITGAKVGLAITQVMSLIGPLQFGVRQSAEVSNQMTTVERVIEYQQLKPECQSDKPKDVTENWPINGSIQFKNVSYRYSKGAAPVLRELSFNIAPKEKIGIVGRTGAGKSSLIGAIFRLALVEGEILIDGIDTFQIKLTDLRSRIAIIPQDPVLFSGTLRRNLDPFEEYSDDDMWRVLEEVELKQIASGSSGLSIDVSAHGSNFSVGQRQLLCLARAILRKNRILVLDEATANVDPQTDSLIQQTIRNKFADCTVLTVAHRLHTIIDSDRVLVMDAGHAIEFDEPYNLLQNETGIFYGMVKALGTVELERLTSIAFENSRINSVQRTQL